MQYVVQITVILYPDVQNQIDPDINLPETSCPEVLLLPGSLPECRLAVIESFRDFRLALELFRESLECLKDTYIRIRLIRTIRIFVIGIYSISGYLFQIQGYPDSFQLYFYNICIRIFKVRIYLRAAAESVNAACLSCCWEVAAAVRAGLYSCFSMSKPSCTWLLSEKKLEHLEFALVDRRGL